MGILKDRFLIILIILGFLIRLILLPLPGFKIDTDAWFAWAIRLNQVGFARFYSDQIWTNYTPGYLYILKFLGFIKITFNLPDNLFYLILKLPSIIAEVILGIFLYQQLGKKASLWARISLVLVLLNPALIFNSAIWGQIDGLVSLLMLLSIYFMFQQKIISSSILLGLAFLIKPQTIGLLPVFILFLIKNFSLKNCLNIFIPVFTTIFVLSLPFFTTHPFGITQLFSKMIGDYSYTSLFAYNFWGAIGFWINDNTYWNNLSYHWWGYMIYSVYWALITYLFLKQKLSIYSLATFAMLSFFFLPTRVHERYLYPGIIFLIILVGIYRSKVLLVLTNLFSLVHFLNLYYVYVYYNEFYSKLPKVLYNPFLYNLLDNKGKILSLISTIIFAVVTLVVIKISYVSKKVHT